MNFEVLAQRPVETIAQLFTPACDFTHHARQRVRHAPVLLGSRRAPVCAGIDVAVQLRMLKLLGSYALAKLLGFGLVGAIVIYLLLTMLT